MAALVKNLGAQLYSRLPIPSWEMSAAVFATNVATGNIGEIYNSFHDIAQINIAKALGGNALLEVPLKGTVADVVGAGAQVWEVKPLGGESAERQLALAEANGLVRGQQLGTIDGITIAPNLYMRIAFPAAGEAKYSFYKYNKKGEEVRVSSVGAALTVMMDAGALVAGGAALAGAIAVAPEVTIPALGTLAPGVAAVAQ